jgi:hypothetical protein
MAVICRAWNTAFPRTSTLPSVDPPGTPFKRSRPTTESAMPSKRARGTAVPKNARASSGVKTTYKPVMNPVLATVVRSSPAVCSA